jgi:hypothetical protein
MIKQARNYMVGAISGAGLLAAGVVAFVLLVSVQVFEDWPVAGLVGSGGDGASVSAADPAAVGTGLRGPAIGDGAEAGAGSAAGGAGQGSGTGNAPATTRQGVGGTGEPGETGAENGEGAPDGNGSTPTAASGGSGGSGGGTASSAGGGGGGAAGGSSGGTTSPSSEVTGTVNETVNQVDQTVAGGALNETGVTQATEEAVNGVAGPESTVGKVVDGTVGTVEGALGN